MIKLESSGVTIIENYENYVPAKPSCHQLTRQQFNSKNSEEEIQEKKGFST